MSPEIKRVLIPNVLCDYSIYKTNCLLRAKKGNGISPRKKSALAYSR